MLKTLPLVLALASNPPRWITPDFFVQEVGGKNIRQELSLPFADDESCRDRIKKLMCLVDPLPDQVEPGPGTQRPCLPGGEAYAGVLETLYDHYPPALQRMFCSLKVIYIEKAFFGTAYAGIMKDPSGNVLGAQMGIRKSVLDERLDLSTWASWKEELSFGGKKDSYTLTPGLPFVSAKTQMQVDEFLYFVIAHEFGHIFDFANDLNKYVDENCGKTDPNAECKMDPTSWGGLSWDTNMQPKAEFDFVNRTGLCFYTCPVGTISLSAAPGLYEDLYRSPFISTYATTEPWDDFADTLAYFLIDRNLASSYVLDTAQGKTYDVIAKLHSPQFEKKWGYVKAFMNRADIKYP